MSVEEHQVTVNHCTEREDSDPNEESTDGERIMITLMKVEMQLCHCLDEMAPFGISISRGMSQSVKTLSEKPKDPRGLPDIFAS